jgi:squalene-hopene/tetraprenyl-beta-curcumene cyclase
MTASITTLRAPLRRDERNLDQAIDRATAALIELQRPDGHWVFELEVDATIPSEYVLMRHFLGEADQDGIERKIAAYLRRTQRREGGWPLVYGGPPDLSASVKAYFALKMIGDDPEAEHMQRARTVILALGGAGKSNAFTRALLALYGILGWNSVPVMPVELMLVPRWFPFHVSKMSYWARTTIVPLLVLQALKPRARNPRGVTIGELFLEPPSTVLAAAKAAHQSWGWFLAFAGLDAVLRVTERFFPKNLRQRAIDKAVAFVRERLNGEDGLGAIFPPMVNTVKMFDALGYPPDHPDRAIARRALDKLLVIKQDEAYCQPCVSPVWDTVLACHALLEVGTDAAVLHAIRGLKWMEPLQVLDVVGDWGEQRPDVRPGGWAFQYANPHYVDLDDTAVIVMAMDRVARMRKPGLDFGQAIARAREWILGLQSRNGGWAAFDADNTHDYLNNIPFADHGALLDPPTADLTARCLSMLGQLGERTSEAIYRGVEWLRRDQNAYGSWAGRWGMNYVYGAWSVLCALNVVGLAASPMARKAVDWLISIQNPDGGWGEDAISYRLDYRGHESAPSTSSQTAWALLGLMAAGQIEHPSVERGIEYLLAHQVEHGLWDEEHYTATGFPRVLYLRYHGYRRFFPLWALARYRTLERTGAPTPFGM